MFVLFKFQVFSLWTSLKSRNDKIMVKPLQHLTFPWCFTLFKHGSTTRRRAWLGAWAGTASMSGCRCGRKKTSASFGVRNGGLDVNLMWFLLIWFMDICWSKDFEKTNDRIDSQPRFFFHFESLTEGGLACVWRYSGWYWWRASKSGCVYHEDWNFNQQTRQWSNKHVNSSENMGAKHNQYEWWKVF